MRAISIDGNQVTLVCDEESIVSVAEAIVKKMESHGFTMDTYKMGRVTIFTTVVDCKKWERAEKGMIREEAVRLLNGSVSSSLLGH